MKKLDLKRLQANRRNASLGTGPVTPEGKRRSAQNALRHGLCAQSVLLPGEYDERFRELLAGFEQDFAPASTVARFQVEQLAVAAWRLRRAQVFEATLVRDQLAATATPTAPLDAQTAVTRAWADSRAGLAARYETTHQRNFRQIYDRLATLECGEPEPVPAPESNQQDPEENTILRNEANPLEHPPV
jgi:hypothetical protein